MADVIPLDRHAIIEASAGTGKTYTIMQIVKRLLFEEGVPLPKILMVTYTEKATGELKTRLLAELEKALRDDDVSHVKAREALDAFDQAAVFTIHGFCQRVLQENAFDNGQDFACEMVDDRRLSESVLREVQRGKWTSCLRDALTKVLTVSAYDGENWESVVRDVSLSFKKSCRHLLRPDTPERIEERFDAFEKRIRDGWGRSRPYAGKLERNAAESHPWVAGYRDMTQVHGTDRKSAEKKLLIPLIEWLADDRTESMPLERTLNLIDKAEEQTGFDQDGLRRMFRRRNGDFADAEALCPGLAKVVEIVDEMLASDDVRTLRCLLASWTITQLQECLKEHKRERALLSFDDMLERLDEALENSPAGLRQLRERYRYAIVDEFQDTDPVQWRIFKRIFAEGGEHRLFVVGDPKQSIFGFRGADVHAYHEARRFLTGECDAGTHPLGTNWRSCAGLIGVLNSVFKDGKFFTDPDIKYEAVDAAGDKCDWKIDDDRTDVKEFALIRWDEETARIGRWKVARAAASEIRRLLGDGEPLLTYRKGAETRRLQAGDICILVGKRSEARSLLDALRQVGVPYTFYKEPGLWETEEAEHLEIVLKAVARPEQAAAFRMALLTRFFRIDPLKVLDAEEAGHSLRERFDRWRELAAVRDWSALFHSLVHDTGVLFAGGDEPDAERRRANLLHITADLQHEAFRRDLDLLDLLERLAEHRGEGGGQDLDLQPIETDRSKVKIMTIHASKGLEFPVVFLLGGFTTGRHESYYTYREDGSRVFDLRTGQKEAKLLHKGEQQLELERLYYVALTRAVFKLYVPLLGGTSVPAAGPLITLVGKAITTAGLHENEQAHVTLRDADAMIDLKPRAGKPSAREVDGRPADTPTKFSGPLFFGDLDKLAARRAYLESFTSLHRRLAAARPRILNDAVREDDEPEEAADPAQFRGAVFGDILHDVLETIDYRHAALATSADDFACRIELQLGEALQKHWLRFPPTITDDPARPEECRRLAADLAYRALTTPLPEIGRLCDIPPEDRLHEIEFQFPYQEKPGEPHPEWPDRFFRGYCDLVFRKSGRYYLLDWKSNHLPDGYAADALEQAMSDNDYHRQYRLYLFALCRWLRARQPGFQFRKHLGGVFYLFVRGMNPGSADGVFHHRPTEADLRLADICSH